MGLFSGRNANMETKIDREKFAVDDDGSGSYVMKATALNDRFKGNRDEQRTYEEDRFSDPNFLSKWMTTKDLLDNDWSWAPDYEVEAMMRSVKVNKVSA